MWLCIIEVSVICSPAPRSSFTLPFEPFVSCNPCRVYRWDLPEVGKSLKSPLEIYGVSCFSQMLALLTPTVLLILVFTRLHILLRQLTGYPIPKSSLITQCLHEKDTYHIPLQWDDGRLVLIRLCFTFWPFIPNCLTSLIDCVYWVCGAY